MRATREAFTLKAGRHADVGHHYLRLGRFGPVDEAFEIAGDAHDLDVLLQLHQSPHSLTDQEVVVGQEDGDGHGPHHAVLACSGTGGRPVDMEWG
ncbi:MAG TPA: hypothetical protein VIL12_01340 [Acidimicrobiia bacterium]